MKKYILYLFIISTGLFTACENDMPYYPGKQEIKLIMNALLETEVKENVVLLNLSGMQETKYIQDGAVTLYVNGKKTETAEALPQWWNTDEPDLQKPCILKTKLSPGDLIRLEATANSGKYHAWAEVQIPQPVGEIKVDTFLTRLKIGNYIQDCMRYKITVNDRPGEKNYYRLAIDKREYWGEPSADTPVSSSYEDIINQEDIVLSDGHLTTTDDENFNIFDTSIQNKFNVFTDNRFLNASHTLKVYTIHHDYNNLWVEYHVVVEATIRILSITEPHYRYLRALNLLESDKYEPTFMEPVIIPNNVQGGLGFVGASSERQAKIRIIDRPPLWPRGI